MEQVPNLSCATCADLVYEVWFLIVYSNIVLTLSLRHCFWGGFALWCQDVPRFENFSIGIWNIWLHYVFPFTFGNISLDYVGLNLLFNVLQLTLFQQSNLIKVVTILLLVIVGAVLFSLRGQIQKMCVLFILQILFP